MKCKACEHILNEGKEQKFIKIQISTGATLNEKAFIIEGLTFYACPNCGTLSVNIQEIRDHINNARVIVSDATVGERIITDEGIMEMVEPPEDKGGFE